MSQKIHNAFAYGANWETIKKNKFFTGNYSHLNSPRTELEARRNSMTRTWNANSREYLYEPRS
jgi:hypothetical protein